MKTAVFRPFFRSALAVLAGSASFPTSAVILSVSLERAHDPSAYVSHPDGSAFLLFPMLASETGPVRGVTVSSLSGNFGGGVGSAWSTAFTSFSDLRDALSAEQFTITIDAGLATESQYRFSIDAVINSAIDMVSPFCPQRDPSRVHS